MQSTLNDESLKYHFRSNYYIQYQFHYNRVIDNKFNPKCDFVNVGLISMTTKVTLGY